MRDGTLVQMTPNPKCYRYFVAIFFALSLPGLVVILILVGVFQLATARVKGKKRPSSASIGIDLLDTILKPGSEHRLHEKESIQLLRDEEGEGAPPLNEPLRKMKIKVKRTH